MGEGTVLVPAAHGGRFGDIPDPEGVDGFSHLRGNALVQTAAVGSRKVDPFRVGIVFS